MHQNDSVLRFPTAEDAQMTDRRQQSTWQDPRLWVSVMSILLTVLLALLGAIWSQLHTISSNVESLTISTTASTTRQAEEIKNLRERLGDLERRQSEFSSNQTTYNFDLSKQLTEIKTEIRMRKR